MARIDLRGGIPVAALWLALAPGCANREVSDVIPNQDQVEQKTIPVNVNRKVDLLFVIDNSGSMQDEQTRLAANFPAFIQVLEHIEGGLPDVHLGVVSSDMGALGVTGVSGCTTPDDGNLQTGGQPVGPSSALTPVCSMVNGNYISDLFDETTGQRLKNYTGELTDAFSCLAVGVGDHGCGFEAHLASMKAALDGNLVNSGFLRPDAYLAVIVIADEDDCSAANPSFFAPENPQLGPLASFRCFEKSVACDQGRDLELRAQGVKTGCIPDDTQNYLHDVEEYVTYLKNLKVRPTDVVVAGIIGLGPTDDIQVLGTGGQAALAPACTTPGDAGNTADPAVRLRAFFDSFPQRNVVRTICNDSYEDALDQIAELVRNLVHYACIDADLVDTDPSTPALDPDCQFSYFTHPGAAEPQETPLAACDAGLTNQPCWHLVLDADHCGTTVTHEKVVVEDPAPPEDAEIRGGCVVR